MLEKALDILKIFLEKYLFPTLISIVLATVVYLLTPTKSTILKKLGKWYYIAVIFIIIFLIINLIIYIYKRIYNKKNIKKGHSKYKDKLENNTLEKTLDFIDNLSIEDRKLFEYFLNNNNEPIVIKGYIVGNEILDNFCIKNNYIVDDNTTYSINFFNDKKELVKKGEQATRYKLKEEIYNGVKYLKEKHGKLSRF